MWLSDDELRAIVRGENIEPGGTNILLMQEMAKELLEVRAHASTCSHCFCDFCTGKQRP